MTKKRIKIKNPFPTQIESELQRTALRQGLPQNGLTCGNCGTDTLNYDHKLRLYVCSECKTKENR